LKNDNLNSKQENYINNLNKNLSGIGAFLSKLQDKVILN